VRGVFLSFYDANDGADIFGAPLTEAFSEGGQVVQYFERSRLVDAQGHIASTPLGLYVTANRHFAPVGQPAAPGGMWFPDTGHTLSGVFLAFWQAHHGNILFGSPISEPLHEQNGDGTGHRYLVQYFQNARLEYHPGLAGSGYAVVVGQLGRQVLHHAGWV
jgi:hypothetical protein